ncbi:helix-turn-helix domain-containing protein [Lihuaxuella thermophila]|uniref:Tetratricopeptide repeat-containing protein n=1 Tax=Lihuaxuella thermophila TaxID=1173111 RepID=A0A1H8II30_9BACL|nr:helix-turn-helix domain-containing protein [Lihuaxuella thermophila]SEN67517.1 Tetratricopeptide repeat-containing protein [Lihuaxuella thermophila]
MGHYLHDGLIRYVIKKTRIDKGLHQRDLADVHISDGTISNIERGKVVVKDDTFHYLLHKLGLDNGKLEELVEQERKRIEHLKFQLDGIESLLENGDLEAAYEDLRLVPMDEFHPLAPYYTYLKGRYEYKRKQWNKASKYFKLALRLCKQHMIDPEDNIISMCFNQLSRCSYHQNDLAQALEYVKHGLEKYDDTKGKREVKYFLFSNKILFLIKSSHLDHASQILNELWPSIPQIDSIPVLLDLYKYRAAILRERGAFQEAISISNEGIEIARRNWIQNQHLDLLNVLGSVYLKNKKFEMAFPRFEMVLKLDRKLKYPRRHVDAHTYLAMLYSAQEDWGKADYHLKKAIDIGRKVADLFRLAKALIVQGNFYYYQQKYNEAIPLYQEASELSERHGFKQRQISALLKLSACFAKMKKTDELHKCNERLVSIINELKIISEDDFYEVWPT